MSKPKMDTDMKVLGIFLSIMGIGVLCLIGMGLYEAFAPDGMQKQQERQEQQFANTFYDQCNKAQGIYSVGSTGYVCFKNGAVLFQSGSVEHDSVK